MAKLHFIRVDTHLVTSELAELAEQIEAGFVAKGRPNDKVILLAMASWLGSVEIDNEGSE
jgi:hypothetical protein